MENSISTNASQSQAADITQSDSGDMYEFESLIKILKNLLTLLASTIEDKYSKQSDSSGSQNQRPVLGTDIIGNTTSGLKAMESSPKSDQNEEVTASASAGVVINLNFDNDNADNEENSGNDIKSTTGDNSGTDQINQQCDTTDIIGNTTSGLKGMESSPKSDQNGEATASANAGVVINLKFDNDNADNEENSGNEIKGTSSDNSGTDQINQQGDENEEIDINQESKGGWGDPHYDLIGADDKPIHFDHKGVDYHNYHLFTGDNIRIEGEYVPTDDPNEPQVIGSTTAYMGNDVLTFTKDGSATLNGEALEDGSHMLEDGTGVVKSGDVLSIIPNDGSGAVDISVKGNSEMKVDPSGKFRNLDGIIGKSIEESRPLSKQECDAFDLT